MGLRGERRRGRRRIPLRLGPRPLPAGLLAPGCGRPRRRRRRGHVAVRAPAARRRDVPADLAGRRHAGDARRPARPDGLPADPRLAARADRRRHLAGHPEGRRRPRDPRPDDAPGALGGDRRLLQLHAAGDDRRPGHGVGHRPPARRHAARRPLAGRRRRVAAQHGAVALHHPGAIRRRPLLHPHRRRRRPQRRLGARLRQRRRRAPGGRGRRRRLPRARAPRRQGAGRSLRARIAPRDGRVARHGHAERPRVAPLHVRRVRRKGRWLAVGAQHAGHQGPGVAAPERRARRVRDRQRPQRAARTCARWPTPPTTAT